MKKVYLITFLSILFFFPLMSIFMKDKEIDEYERRYLTQFPITFTEYEKDFETYLSDQFPFRYQLRQLKGFFNYNIFGKLENQDIVIQDGSAIKLDSDYNYENIKKTTQKLKTLRNELFPTNKCYFALVPDKNCYYKNESIAGNYDKVFNLIKEDLFGIKMINLYSKIALTDYYRTDSHWSQENIIDTSNYILEEMKVNVENVEYNKETIEDFNGVYVGQSALPLKPDTITYLTNDTLNSATVFNYETNSTTNIYTLEKLTDGKSLDNYDIFLNGPSSLLKITNKNQTNNKTLIIFRDSYGSSITPLFIEYYTSIYMVDLRYIESSYIDKFIDIKPTDDILFLYSTTLMEIPENFKIN